MRQYLFYLAVLLVVVGAVNWALTAHQMNLVSMASGGNQMVENGVYYVVAVAGLYLVYEIYRLRKDLDAALKKEEKSA
jgi:uncharacterized membrane protein YuzA (DUF378 family)